VVYLSLMRLALWNNPIHEVGVTVYGEIINNLRFADDIDLIAVNMKIDSLNTEEHPQQLATAAHNSSQIPGLKINVVKTKTMVIIKQNISVNIKLGNEQLKQVDDFVYLAVLHCQVNKVIDLFQCQCLQMMDLVTKIIIWNIIRMASAVVGKLGRILGDK